MSTYLNLQTPSLIERPDMTPYIHHFTRETRRRSAFDVLVRILEQGRLLGSGNEGFIQGDQTAVCFMDVPLPGLKFLLNKENAGSYQPYGVSISKGYALAHRVRPVLYLSNQERDALGIPPRERWRVSRLEYDRTVSGDGDAVTMKMRSDWTHEREWRAPGNFALPKRCIVYVWTANEARRLWKRVVEKPKYFKTTPRAVIPLEIILASC